MTDILSKWKTNRYIVVPAGEVGYTNASRIVILTDPQYWSTHYDELDIWCNTHGAIAVGMTVDFPDDKILTLFCLKWA